jgi:hypothetical protein
MTFGEGAVLCAGPKWHYLQCVSGKWKMEKAEREERSANGPVGMLQPHRRINPQTRKLAGIKRSGGDCQL